MRVAKAVSHFGEEPAISGTQGSGAIFFSHCNLKCCFCQNFQISQEALRMLDGIIDVYLPDAKYADDSCAQKYSEAKNYRNINLKALEEIFRQG